MARAFALIFGIIYTLAGIVGFIAPLGGTLGMAPSELLHLAHVNLVHNILYLVIGLSCVVVAGDEATATWYCQWLGVVLVGVALLGFFCPNPLGLVPIGGRDPWIHLISGVVLASVGFRSAATAYA